MAAPLSPITEKVYRALIPMNISNDTTDKDRHSYTSATLSLQHPEVETQELLDASKSFESFNLAYEDNFLGFIKDIYEMNKDNIILVKTDLNEYDNPALLHILTLLDYRDKLLFLNLIKNSTTGLYIARDEQLLILLTKLATRNLVFGTFHFLKIPVAICCGPDLKFQVYFNDFAQIDPYLEIAKEHELYFDELQVKY